MKSHEFCYWLQGFFELRDRGFSEEETLSTGQVSLIKKHLALVFKHEIDNKYGNQNHLDELNDIHDGTSGPSKPTYRC